LEVSIESTTAADPAVVERLIARHGEGEAERIRRGVAQVAERWRPEDGDAAALAAFCDEHFLVEAADLAAAFARIEAVLEQVDGHLYEVRRELTTPLDLDTGPIQPVDRLFADLDLSAHVDEDLFRTRIAFLALLNFPLWSLAEKLAKGGSWDRETWARARMTDRFAQRVPPQVLQEATRAYVATERYISAYNIRLDRLVDGAGARPFPEGMRQISHWGLRDELASYYAHPSAEGLAKQRLILTVMQRIVRQEIPAAVVDNPDLLWNPETNEVRPVVLEAASETASAPAADLGAREPDTRYAHLLSIFQALRGIDPYSPGEPTYIQRRFERDRQMPEGEVEALLVSVLDSPEARALGQLISRRLGRPLEPFDLWYSGFKARGRYSEDELDAIVGKRYPSLEAFASGLPELLERMGFRAERARWLAERIVVDPARGAGHAMQALRRQDKAHLRTRVPSEGGMDYKGYNVAMHELGHNVEQVFSLNGIDHWWLSGVPNTGCTEAFAFVFQERDLELLGLAPPDAEARGAASLATLWNTYEIAGVSLVDMGVWNWLYAHPEATPAELREAVLSIARGVWNRYFAPVFGSEDCEVLAIYSHMIAYGLYLPDYAIGHLVAFQIAARLREGEFGDEVERITRQGRLTPDAWMRGAVGAPVSGAALLAAAREALAAAG
jgi:hypothetical protein